MQYVQNIEKKRNIQSETANTINLNPSKITRCELVTEDTSNTKANPSIQQKKDKQFAFIIEDNGVKDIEGYLLRALIKKQLMAKV